MSLRKSQSEFTKALGLLIDFAYYFGYELTLGDTYPGKYNHIKGSYHQNGLAIDINLFRDNKYLRKTDDHKLLGNYWKMLGGTWGGDFKYKDGNHYSWGEE